MFDKSRFGTADYSLKSISNRTVFFVLIMIVVLAFIAYNSWHEYQIYQVNQDIEDNPTAAGSDSDLVLTWDDNADNEQGYYIERKVDGNFLLVASLAADETSYTEVNLVAGTSYCYRVGAFNAAGSAYSNEYCLDENVDPVDPIEPDIPDEPSYASLFDVDMYSKKLIDVTDLKYMSSQGVFGNEVGTNIEVVKFEYVGKANFREKGYSFVNNDTVVDKGATRMKWNEKNAVLLEIINPGDPSAVSIVSLYFRARAQTSDTASLGLMINNELNLIELTEESKWMRIRADIEFQGTLSIELRPVGKFTKSKLDFAGLTLL